MANYIVRRGLWYHFNKRVPQALKELEQRDYVQVTLKTKCPDTAARRAAILNEYVDAYWSDIIENGPDNKELKFKRAMRMAELHGFRYKPATVIADEDLPQIIRRVEAVRNYKDDEGQVEAILGGAGEPQLLVSEALNEFWDYARHKTLHKNDEQIRIWRNPRKRAVNNFIEVVGDKPVQEVRRADLLELRDWWIDRMETEGVSANTVNKEVVQFLREFLSTVNDNHEPALNLDIESLFKKLRLAPDEETRPPFSTPSYRTCCSIRKSSPAWMRTDAC